MNYTQEDVLIHLNKDGIFEHIVDDYNSYSIIKETTEYDKIGYSVYANKFNPLDDITPITRQGLFRYRTLDLAINTLNSLINNPFKR